MIHHIAWSTGALGAALLATTALTAAPVGEVAAQEIESCPCSFSSAVRTRGFSGAEMSCVSEDADIAFVPPEGVTNKQNRFVVTERNRKGEVTKVTEFRLYEQGLLPAADFGGVVRYAPTCVVAQADRRRTRVFEAAYVVTAGEYAECARDLSAFAVSVASIASDPDTGCGDADLDGVVDEWEPLNPVTTQYCFNEFGNPIVCP